MNPLWDQLDALAGEAVTAFFGTACQIRPMRSGEYTVGPDPDRAAVEVRGVFSLAPDTDDARGQRTQGAFPGTTRTVLAEAAVQIVAAEAAKIGYLPRSGDHVHLPDVSGHRLYQANVVHHLDGGDLLIELTRVLP